MLVRDTGVFSEFGAEDYGIALVPPSREFSAAPLVSHFLSETGFSCGTENAWKREEMKRHASPGPVRARNAAGFQTRTVSRRNDRKHEIPEYLIRYCRIRS